MGVIFQVRNPEKLARVQSSPATIFLQRTCFYLTCTVSVSCQIYVMTEYLERVPQSHAIRQARALLQGTAEADVVGFLVGDQMDEKKLGKSLEL